MRKAISGDGKRSVSRHGTKQIATAQAEHHDPPLLESIRMRAYALYVARGRDAGSEVDDWLRAERAVLDERGLATSVGTE